MARHCGLNAMIAGWVICNDAIITPAQCCIDFLCEGQESLQCECGSKELGAADSRPLR